MTSAGMRMKTTEITKTSFNTWSNMSPHPRGVGCPGHGRSDTMVLIHSVMLSTRAVVSAS
jgi:hypothetical protein